MASDPAQGSPGAGASKKRPRLPAPISPSVYYGTWTGKDKAYVSEMLVVEKRAKKETKRAFFRQAEAIEYRSKSCV